MSKVVIVYDSVFGNTEMIAQAIAGSKVENITIDLRRVGDVTIDELSGVKTLIIGSPTRQFKATGATDRFLNQFTKDSLNGVKIAAFDTRMTEAEINSNKFLSFMVKLFGYAAEKISKRLKKLGGVVVAPPVGFYVKGVEGPLLDGELERASKWALTVFNNS